MGGQCGGRAGRDPAGWERRGRGGRVEAAVQNKKKHDLKPFSTETGEFWMSIQLGGSVVKEDPSAGTMDFFLPRLLFIFSSSCA